MEVYAAIDLHASNSFLAVVDREGKRVFKRRLVNDSAILLNALESLQGRYAGHSSGIHFQLYWVVDALMEAGYRVHLANPAAIQKYKGLKHSDDKSDALWLAEMLRSGYFARRTYIPEGKRPSAGLVTQTDALGQTENLPH